MDSSASGHRYEFITAKKEWDIHLWCKGKLLLRSNQMYWTKTTSLRSRIIPPLQFHKVTISPVFVKTQHKEDRNFLRAKALLRDLGGPRKEVLYVEKLVLELTWGNMFPRKGNRGESHILMDQLYLSCVFLFTNCFSPLPIPSPTTVLHFRVAFSPTFFYPLQYFSPP